jgi:hypothetical protein
MRQGMLLAIAISSLAMVSVVGCYSKPGEEPKQEAPAPAAPAEDAAPPAEGGAPK